MSDQPFSDDKKSAVTKVTSLVSIDQPASPLAPPEVAASKGFEDLEKALLVNDREKLIKIVQGLITTGLPKDQIVDHFIPALAHKLGNDWCTDGKSFAEVTIGASRLQGLLRYLRTSDKTGFDPNTPNILLLVAKGAHHTLGAMVLRDQLERRGLYVRLMLGGSTDEIAQELRFKDYNAVFISSSRGETLESLSRIMDGIRTLSEVPPPVVIGGTILEIREKNDLLSHTGADFATGNPDEALRLCGILNRRPIKAPAMQGV